MRYKILFISSWFPSKIEATNGNFVQRHAEAVSLLHEVEILHAIGDKAQKKNYFFDDQIINGIRTLIVYYKNTNNPILNFYRRINSYKKGFAKMQNPDLVHANILQKSMLFAVYLKWKFKVPFVVTEHWSGFLKINRGKLSKIQLFISKFIAKEAHFVLPVSYYLKNDLEDLRFQNAVEVVENVVDTAVFHVKESKNNRFAFLHISNLVSLKNPDKIIEVAILLAKEFQNFELQIGGDGDVESLKKIIKENKAENYIRTFATLSSKEVAEKMRNSDCFILFSNYENFPCVLLESLSCGTPAIATKVGGIPEIINDKNGVLISNNETDLLVAMRNVLLQNTNFQNPEHLHQLIENRFSMPVIAQKFDLIYKKVLASF